MLSFVNISRKISTFVLFRNQFSAPSVLTARPFSVLTAMAVLPYNVYRRSIHRRRLKPHGSALCRTLLFFKNSFHGVFYRIKKRQNKQGFFSLLSAFSTRKRINLLRIMRTTRKLLITAGFINRVCAFYKHCFYLTAKAKHDLSAVSALLLPPLP